MTTSTTSAKSTVAKSTTKPAAKKTTTAASKTTTTAKTSVAKTSAVAKSATKPAAKKTTTKPAAKKTTTKPAAKATSKVVKVGGEKRQSRKADKFNKLEQMLRDAGKDGKPVIKDGIAKAIGATPGSVGVMISELRKDAVWKAGITSSKDGYMFVEAKKS